MPTKVYYVSYRNNAFDTHVFQNNVHRRLLTYTSDAVSAFMQDLERIGRADDVALMIFSEFGRRVPENVISARTTVREQHVCNRQTDTGGHYGELPSLTQLNPEDNLAYTTDFRCLSDRDQWLARHQGSRDLLHGDFQPFELF